MHNWKWSDAEKKLVRRIHQEARLKELSETLSDFKARATALVTIDEMWPLEDYLRQRRRELDEKYDYRYSILGFLLARLVREGRVQPAQLSGLSEEKLSTILKIASP